MGTLRKEPGEDSPGSFIVVLADPRYLRRDVTATAESIAPPVNTARASSSQPARASFPPGPLPVFGALTTPSTWLAFVAVGFGGTIVAVGAGAVVDVAAGVTLETGGLLGQRELSIPPMQGVGCGA